MGRQSVSQQGFSRGLDLVSSLSDIEPGFTPSAMNMRCSEWGGIEKILGYTAHADLGSGVSGHELFYYQHRDADPKFLVAASATKWQSIQADGTVADIRTTNSAGGALTSVTDTTFVQYGDSVYGLDESNNMASWDGTTLTQHAVGVSTGPPTGIILGIWSNRMWVADSGTTVVWSDAGSMTSWPAANTATLGGTGGGSSKIVGGIPTEMGVLVFCTDCIYLITDTDGTNRLVDGEHGCISRKSIARINDHIYFMNYQGIHRTNGNMPSEYVSRRVEPLFSSEAPTLSSAAGVNWRNSYLLSYSRSAAYNDFTLDHRPELGSTMANQYRAKAWAVGELEGTSKSIYFIDAGNQRYVRTAFDGGAFLTTASPGVASDISCWYETPPLNFEDEAHIKRLHRVRLVGRGDMYVGARVDYLGYNSIADRLSFPSIVAALWDTAVWDVDEWGGFTLFEGWASVPAKGRRIQLRFYESSDDTFPGRPNLDSDEGLTLGGAGLYLCEAIFSTSSKRRLR